MDKEYSDFVERMGSFEMELSLEDVGQDNNIAHSDVDDFLSMAASDAIQHYGVKGMKWGVRRNRNKPGGADGIKESKKSGQNGNKVSNLVNDQLASMKRERQWKKSLKNVDNMTDKEINQLANRIRLENDLKRLSKGPAGKRNDKKDYTNRGKMTDQELFEKVQNLRARDNLQRSVSDATKAQRELGKRVVRTVSSVGVKYAINGKITTKDIGMAALKSNNSIGKELTDKLANRVLDKTDRVVLKRKRQ